MFTVFMFFMSKVSSGGRTDCSMLNAGCGHMMSRGSGETHLAERTNPLSSSPAGYAVHTEDMHAAVDHSFVLWSCDVHQTYK